MTPSLKRRSLFSLALGGIVFSAVACDESAQVKADRQVQQAADAGALLRRTPTTQSLRTAEAEFTKAASVSGASHTSAIRAHASLGQTQYDLGRRSADDARAIAPAIDRLVWEIGQDAIQIGQINGAVDALAKNEPTATLKAIADRRAEMVAAGEAAGQKAAALQGEIDKINTQVKAWQQEKDAAITSADADTTKSESAKGAEVSALLDKASESRRKAGNLGHQIDKLSAGLFPLERDLEAEQVKKQTADAAVAGLDAKKKSVDDAWTATQAEIAKQKDAAKNIGEALAAKAKSLEALNVKADGLRKDADVFFDNASKAYAAATSDATSLLTDLHKWSNNESYKNAAEKQAWDRLREIDSPDLFKLLNAQTIHAQADMHAEHLAQVKDQEKLGTDITAPLLAAGVAMPATLSDLSTVEKTADAATKAAYVKAATLYLEVHSPGAGLASIEQAAKICHMYATFGLYLNGDASKLETAKQEFSVAFPGDDRKSDAAKLAPAVLRGDNPG